MDTLTFKLGPDVAFLIEGMPSRSRSYGEVFIIEETSQMGADWAPDVHVTYVQGPRPDTDN